MAGRPKAIIDWKEMMPKVTAEHKSESFDVLGRAFQRIVLNKESDN